MPDPIPMVNVQIDGDLTLNFSAVPLTVKRVRRERKWDKPDLHL